MTALALALVILGAGGPDAPVDFDTEIMPILTRAGCNAGSCHGAAVGRGGFKLSLLGSEPDADYDALANQLEGRRLNLAEPSESLIVLKATGVMPHGGGLRLKPSGPGAERLMSWIQAGAPRARARRLLRFDVQPADYLADRPGSAVAIRAIAEFDDGTTRDVTAWTVFTSSDSTAIEIVDQTARVHRRGRSTVIARFMDRIVPMRFTIPLGDAAVDLAGEPRRNYVDDEVLATLEQLRVPAAPLADDASFLRRVRLDLTGTLPTVDEARQFVADADPAKRTRLVDRLLESPEYVDYWSYVWGKRLQISSAPLGDVGARTFHDWVRQQVARDTPLDEMARSLLLALGDAHLTGPPNFVRLAPNPRDHAEYVSRVFLGVRVACANCHNHPLDRWTQDDYHGLAAVFAKLDRGQHVRLIGRGDVIHPRTGEPARPKLPGGKFLPAGCDNRAAVAEWFTAPGNPLFARSAVNRLWSALFGRGLVEPVDDLRETNPATHPGLLDRLAAEFVESGYRARPILRRIATSATYARSSQADTASAFDQRFYSRALPRPLEPEVLADAIAIVTGVHDQYGTQPLGTRAVQLCDPRVPAPALDILGRCSRTASCETDAAASAGLPRTLHLINGELLNRKITAVDGWLRAMHDRGLDSSEFVESIYWRALGRPPRDSERTQWQKRVEESGPDDRLALFEDLFWAVLTCREFVSNH